MLAYVLLACLCIPLLLLVGDVMRPNRSTEASRVVQSPRPHVTADASGRRGAHEVADLESQRPPRIAPGDGMVYRGPLRAR